MPTRSGLTHFPTRRDTNTMFNALGNLVNRYWLAFLVGWVVLAVGLSLVAPSWDQVALDGDFDYLPSDTTSRQGVELLREAFPDERAKSQIVLVFARNGEKLTNADRDFAFRMAHDRLAQLDLPWADPEERVWTEKTQVVGRMLRNRENTAVMVVGRIATDMMATENVHVLNTVKQMIHEARQEPPEGLGAPEGLEIGISGSTLIGGDMQASIQESLKSTETTTIALVLICLLVIYRSPLLVIIPMATIAVSLRVASDVIALLAMHLGPDDFEWSDFKVFTTTKIFVVVILFGAGTDFCLFLIARFKEELGEGVPLNKASGVALGNVGEALLASAFTTIMGLATMFFASYGKFVYSGPVIAVCLFIALLACVTFAPSLLRAFGKVVFWPFGVHGEKNDQEKERDFDAQLQSISPLWDRIARGVLARPGLILWITVPFAAFFINEGLHVNVTHDFMNELAPDRASKIGTEMVRRYYPPGEASPTTIVATLPTGELDQPNNYDLAYLHNYIYHLDGVADVRSLYKPEGGDPSRGKGLPALTVAGSPLAKSTFVSEVPEYAGKVTQLSVVLEADPFSREARRILTDIESKLAAVARGVPVEEDPPEDLSRNELRHWTVAIQNLNKWQGASFEYTGTTSGIRDLERTTESDRITIQVLVVLAVFTVIVLILRRFLVCVYLIITVLLSYWVTIGITEMVFRWYYQGTYDGLDWKCPIFLFVILIAVGQDYNIYLATRVFEEQKKYGLRRGLRRAMVQTGGIITSCGVIMAGTFIAMATGTLRGMVELGFALALGVLLDTFFVRTIIVPCLFALMAGKKEPEEPPAPAIAPPDEQHAPSQAPGAETPGDQESLGNGTGNGATPHSSSAAKNASSGPQR